MVDTNIIAYLYLPGNFTSLAEALLQYEPEWAAPVLWLSEFRNILAGYMRRRYLSYEQARDIQAEAENHLLGLEFEVDSHSVLALVRDSDCSAYDCEFIALTMKLSTTLYTMDAKLLQAFPHHATALTAQM